VVGCAAAERAVAWRSISAPRGSSTDSAKPTAAGSSRTPEKVLTETVGYLGAGITTVISLFNPERIVLGGWRSAARAAGR
jgi:predicted NBD/HSP70 family sugar kinase